MSKIKTERWTEVYAREVLERARRRNLSDSALARELGVSPQRVHWWRKRLEGNEAPQPAFAEVKLAAPAAQPSAPAAQPFTVRTHSGHTIEVWPGFDGDELARLLAVVEGKPC